MAALRYIVGGSGSGKTELCLKEITRQSKEDSVSSLIYIVPEQFTLQSEKNLLLFANEQNQNKSMIRQQVLSFQRLGFHLFSEMGMSAGKFLDDAGKNMLLRRIVSEQKEHLTFFGKSIDKQGFIDTLNLTIREFYQYNVNLENFSQYLEGIKDKESLYEKMKDLYRIFEHYVAYIDQNYISTDATLDMVSTKIEDSVFLEDAEIWIDNFTGFTPQEYKVVGELLKKVKRVNIALALKSDEHYFNALRESDPFYEVKNTVNILYQLASNHGVSVEEPTYLQEPVRFHHFPELAYLEKNFFNVRHAQYQSEQVDNISILQASNSYGEITETAIQIIELAREKGYRFSDIAVVSGNPPGYEKGIRSIFNQYSIPYFMDSKLDILSHPLTELIRSAVDIVAFNWSYEAVFRFLKTNLTGLETNEIDCLENYVLAYGMKGYRWSLEKWEYGFDSGLYDDEFINRCREKVIECLKPFTEGMPRDKKLEIKEFLIRIVNMLDKLDVNTTLDRWVEDMVAADSMTVAKEHSQIWAKVCGVFDKMAEILGDELVTPREFGKIIEAGFKTTDMGMIPPTQDGVIIGDMERSRLPKIKALFVLGVNEGILPGIKKELGMFSDEERISLNRLGMELAPDSKRKSYEEQFLIYCGLTKPEELLQLSYSIGNLEGKALKPSGIIGKINKMFPGLAIKYESDHHKITLPKPMFNKMGGVLRDHASGNEISKQNQSVYVWFSSSGLYKKKLDTMEKMLFERKKEEFLSVKSTKKLYDNEIVAGISRLERYVQCPFAYYVQYNLDAKERKIYGVQPVDIGNLFHDVLEEFSTRLEQENTNWRELDQDKIDGYVEKSIDEIAPKLGNEVMLSSAKYQYTIGRIKRIAKKSIWALSEHIKSGVFEPMGAELEFKGGTPLSSIVIELNDTQRLILTGRIDRVDIMDDEGNKYVKIIDYKSGNKRFDLSDIYFGMQLQLLIYLDAFIKHGVEFFGEENVSGEILPGGVFYFRIDDPILEYKEETVPEKLKEMILNSFKMTGLVLADEKVIKGMDQNISKWSKIIPVYMADSGKIGEKSAVADYESFENLRQVTVEKAKETAGRMVEGNINIHPFKKTQGATLTACDYCQYGAICQVDLLEEKNKYNIVKKI